MTASSSGSAALLDKKHIGPYIVERILGEGGMGKVYACRDLKLDRQVAIKVLLDDVAKDPEMSARFKREAQAMAKLSSPYVITIFEVGDDNGVPFIAMELLEGVDVGGLIEKKGALPPDVATGYILDAARGLKAAYHAGLVHRDVKPANLFLAETGCKLADFGLARPIDGSADLTSTGIVVGSPHYLAPEVARGGPATLQSDVYSLGATFFEMLTGETPFRGKTPLEVISAHLTQEAPRAHPDFLGDVIAQMLHKEPNQRFATYAALIDKLNAVQLSPEEGTKQEEKEQKTNQSSSTQLFSANKSSDTARATALLTNPTCAPVATSTENILKKETPPATGVTWAAMSTPKNPTSRNKIRTENLTIMFTDIVGYTMTTSSQTREQAAAWLKLHDGLLRPVIKAFSGKIIKTIGDALLVTFKSPTDGVLCGCAIQDQLYNHNQNCDESAKLHVRVALSTGEVRLESNDVFGEPVNIAARLESIAEPGEVLFSDATYATMNTAELPTLARGSRSLKGIQRPVTLFAAQPALDDNGPPFRGRALSRVNSSESLLEQASKGVADVASNLAALAYTSKDTPLARKKTSKNILLLAAAAVVLAFILSLVSLLFSLFGSIFQPAEMALIDEGKAEEVIARLEPKKEPTPEENLILGHAYAAVDDDKNAADAFHDAFSDNVHDKRAKETLIDMFGSAAQKNAEEALAIWPDDDIDDEMAKLSLSNAWGIRHGAYGVLKLRDKRKLIDEEAFGVLDLTEGSTCARRHFGLKMLKRAGKSHDALEVVREAGQRLPDNLCLILDVNSTERAIQKKIK